VTAPDPMTHAEASALLPWAANQSLPHAVREAVVSHSLACVSCRRELHNLTAHVDELSSRNDAISVPAPDMRRINQRIDAHIFARGRAVRVLGRMLNFFADPWRAAVALQSVIIVIIGVLYVTPEPDESIFTTLSESASLPAGDYIRAVFSPELGTQEMNSLLQKFELVAFDGPSERGVYTLIHRGEDARDMEATALRLRQDERVLFVQALNSSLEP